jgi:hypothetical protein
VLSLLFVIVAVQIALHGLYLLWRKLRDKRDTEIREWRVKAEAI